MYALPIAAQFAVDAVKRSAGSALPNAPVVHEDRVREAGLVRAGLTALRSLAVRRHHRHVPATHAGT